MRLNHVSVLSCTHRLPIPAPPLSSFCAIQRRGKKDLSMVPPWYRHARTNHKIKAPKVDVTVTAKALGSIHDADALTETLVEAVPWRRDDRTFLAAAVRRIDELLPSLSHSNAVQLLIGFGATRRRHDPVLAKLVGRIDPAAVVDENAVELVSATKRLNLGSAGFDLCDAICRRIAAEDIWLSESQLAALMRLHGKTKTISPVLFGYVVSRCRDRFDFFTEDEIGDLCRAFRDIRYRDDAFFKVLHEHLPYRLHEYRYWNLIDIAECYQKLDVQDREIITRVGVEAWKLIFTLKKTYPVKALTVLSFLDAMEPGVFRGILRTLFGSLRYRIPTDLVAESIVACQRCGYTKRNLYHRLSVWLQQRVREISRPLLVTEVVAALAKVPCTEPALFRAIGREVQRNPQLYHFEHLVSIARDFVYLGYSLEPFLQELCTALRLPEVPTSSPSALACVPFVLGHWSPPPSMLPGGTHPYRDLLALTLELLAAPNTYTLRRDLYDGKDDVWAEGEDRRIRDVHFMPGGKYEILTDTSTSDDASYPSDSFPHQSDLPPASSLPPSPATHVRVARIRAKTASKLEDSLPPSQYGRRGRRSSSRRQQLEAVATVASEVAKDKEGGTGVANRLAWSWDVFGMREPGAAETRFPFTAQNILRLLRGERRQEGTSEEPSDAPATREEPVTPPPAVAEATTAASEAPAEPTPPSPESSSSSTSSSGATVDVQVVEVIKRPALEFVNVEEITLIMRGLDRLRVRHDGLLERVTAWLGQRWEEVEACHLTGLLHAFGNLGYSSTALRTVMDLLVKKHASSLADSEVAAAVWAAYTFGMRVDDEPFQLLLRRFRGLAVPLEPEHHHLMQVLSVALRQDAMENMTSRFPDAAYDFCRWVDEHLPGAPQLPPLPQGRALFLDSVGAFLDNIQVPHSLQYRYFPFVIDVAIPDTTTAYTSSLIGLPPEGLSQHNWMIPDRPDTLPAASKAPQQHSASSDHHGGHEPAGGEGGNGDGSSGGGGGVPLPAFPNMLPVLATNGPGALRHIMNLASKGNQQLNFNGPQGDMNGGMRNGGFDGGSATMMAGGPTAFGSRQGTALFLIDTPDSIYVRPAEEWNHANAASGTTHPHQMTAYERIREGVLHRLGWRVAYFPNNSLDMGGHT
ncbi:unnamed protein product [Vitrella brassicaformis CCMP3155]|uniref:RAP domain-containing protein n=4 Tax=Vitrella brassicaformis TaxID=1169539 RepID=A0A0G4GBS3_VITBC|nr:unnamed protein product [Vitrella brassicaformis CCMP3155]|eukprot:CEM26287.1 unnamed protein product [Vitrella brassicaformis CCMP3155]